MSERKQDGPVPRVQMRILECIPGGRAISLRELINRTGPRFNRKSVTNALYLLVQRGVVTASKRAATTVYQMNKPTEPRPAE